MAVGKGPDLVCTAVILEKRRYEGKDDGEAEQVQQQREEEDHQGPVGAGSALLRSPCPGWLRVIGLHAGFLLFPQL